MRASNLKEQLDRFPLAERPTLIVMSVAHSGSTPVAKALSLCGWNIAERNHHYARRAELSRVSIINNCIIDNMRGITEGEMDSLSTSLYDTLSEVRHSSYVIKDPRWCLTLQEPLVLGAVQNTHPDAVLIHLKRNPEHVARSFINRSETVERGGQQVPGEFGYSTGEMYDSADKVYGEWEGRKVAIYLEDILYTVETSSRKQFINSLGISEFGPFDRESVELAMSLFDPELVDPGKPRKRPSGWDASNKFEQGE